MWEYRVEMFFADGFLFGKVNKFEVENSLNDLSNLGWEVVSTTSLNRIFGETHNVLYTLRREKQA